MSRYNRCNECYNMKCVFVTGERTDFDTSECADFRPMTNADRIRAMSDEELAELLENLTREAHNYGYACADSVEGEKPYPDSWLVWMKQECTDAL